MATEPTSGPIVGSGGKVSVDSTELNDVRNWSVTRNCDIKKYVSSSTAGQTKTGIGPKDQEIKFELYIDQGEMDVGFNEGDLVTFIGYTASAKTYTQDVRVSSIEVGVDIEGAEFEGCTVTCVGHGTYTLA